MNSSRIVKNQLRKGLHILLRRVKMDIIVICMDNMKCDGEEQRVLQRNGPDRMNKEELKVRWYSHYIDDFVLIHESKAYLQECLKRIREHLDYLGLELNNKTQIFPLRNGVDYLGFHKYLT